MGTDGPTHKVSYRVVAVTKNKNHKFNDASSPHRDCLTLHLPIPQSTGLSLSVCLTI